MKIMDATLALFDRIVNRNLNVRKIFLSANNTTKEEETVFQLDLFTDMQKLEREKKLQYALLSIKKRYGKNAILKGMNLEEGGRTIERNLQIGGHKM